MIGYAARGRLPAKPHTVFRDGDGRLLHEQCFTQGGFDGPFSILYHRAPPQNHGGGEAVEALWPGRAEVDDVATLPLRRQHFATFRAGGEGTPTTGRKPLMFNGDLTVGVVRPVAADAFCFANADGDEVLYCHAGGGRLWTWFGVLDFGPGDYVIIPRSVPYRFELDGRVQSWLWIECRTPVRVPRQYRNPIGQLRMDAPYTARDFQVPAWEDPPEAPREVITKRRDRFTRHTWGGPVFDVEGWDGTVYPVVFPISRFSPKAGQVHLPPTVHGTFATEGSLICSFVPRAVDFGEGAIPCPYPHSNVDVDEVIFYCDGDFTSRRGLQAGSVSFHPAGVPHGPHPGAYEASIGVRQTSETAVMIDTFEPLRITAAGRALEAPDYDDSWMPKELP
ncbi:MAG: homogentisate 1,2-dioxygenase [bacterium]